jgi:hypothetical protein
MRFARSTVELVLLLALLLIGFGYLLTYYPDLLPTVDGHDYIWFGQLTFFGFALDYLTRNDPFFKTKYYHISRFGIGVFILALLFKILHLQFADYILMASAVLIPLPYVVWTMGLKEFNLRASLNSLLIVALIALFASRLLRINLPIAILDFTFPLAIIAVAIQWYNYRNRRSKNVL